MDKSYYFLTGTANKIWRENDAREEERLFEHISSEKEAYFRRVIFKNALVPEYKLKELAETAFMAVWEDITVKGRAGTLGINSADFRGYFYQAFKNNYLGLLAKEISRIKAEKIFVQRQPGIDVLPEEQLFSAFSDRTLAVLKQTGEGCRELLTWRFAENLTYDEIAEKKKGKINRASAIKIVARCKKRFLTIWNNLN